MSQNLEMVCMYILVEVEFINIYIYFNYSSHFNVYVNMCMPFRLLNSTAGLKTMQVTSSHAP